MDWISGDGRLLTVCQTPTFCPRNREQRTIPLTMTLRTFLAKQKLAGPFLLRPEISSGRHVYRYDFRRPFADDMNARGCSWVTPHVMRHTFASLLASDRVSIYKVATWLGDDVRVVQKHYAELVPDDGDSQKAFA